jgi:hypothetical protein
MWDASPTQHPIPACPRCGAGHVVRNGRNATGTPTFLCRACGRRFVERPESGPVPDDTKDRIRRLPGERMSLRGIARVTGASRSWLRGSSTPYTGTGPRTAPGRSEEVRPAGDRGRRAPEFRGRRGGRVVGVGGPRRRHPSGRGDGRRGPVGGHSRVPVGGPAGRVSGPRPCTDVVARYKAVAPEDRHAATGGAPGSCGRRGPSPSARTTTSGHSGTSSACTTHHSCRAIAFSSAVSRSAAATTNV